LHLYAEKTWNRVLKNDVIVTPMTGEICKLRAYVANTCLINNNSNNNNSEFI